ncbi:MAG TPA: hypothetical protein VIG07_12635 [Methylomirabilota bacterium]|jgi:hypothetical protein
MIVRAVAVTSLTILTAGCAAAAPVYVYSKPGGTVEQMMRDEADCAGGAGGGEVSSARRRRCMSERGYSAQELRQGSYLEIRDMPRPVQTP